MTRSGTIYDSFLEMLTGLAKYTSPEKLIMPSSAASIKIYNYKKRIMLPEARSRILNDVSCWGIDVTFAETKRLLPYAMRTND